jgi:hypothetical protein
MKLPFLTATLLFTLLQLTITAQKPKPKPAPKAAAGFVLKNGDILVYEVNVNGDVYNFEVAIKEIREAIVFDWTMPQKDMSGEVTLEKEARAGATVYKNFFKDGEDWAFTDTSTVWMSRKNYNEAKKGGTIMTVDRNGAERFDKKPGGALDITFKGKPMKIKYMQVSNADGSRTLQVLDNVAQPLIVNMNLGWTITLKEVKAL